MNTAVLHVNWALTTELQTYKVKWHGTFSKNLINIKKFKPYERKYIIQKLFPEHNSIKLQSSEN